MNPNLAKLQAYPFEKLAQLKAGETPPASLAHIALSIGEPKHPAPAFVLDVLRDKLTELGSYPATLGLPLLREAIARWLERRFTLPAASVEPSTWPGPKMLPVAGVDAGAVAIAVAVAAAVAAGVGEAAAAVSVAAGAVVGDASGEAGADGSAVAVAGAVVARAGAVVVAASVATVGITTVVAAVGGGGSSVAVASAGVRPQAVIAVGAKASSRNRASRFIEPPMNRGRAPLATADALL